MPSEKQDKRICNRKHRKLAKDRLKKDVEDYIEPDQREVMDTWSMAKDRGE